MGKLSPSQDTDNNNLLGVRDGHHRRADKSKEQWRVDTLKRLRLPECQCKYGGNPLAIIAHTPLRLSLACQTTEATVLIQKGAPNQLLLGTDVLSNPGFVLMLKTLDGEATYRRRRHRCRERREGYLRRADHNHQAQAGGPTSDATGKSLPSCQNTVTSNNNNSKGSHSH